MKLKVYIACPYTKGDVAVNVRNSMNAWDMVYDSGMIPFNPLFTHFQHIHHPRSYEAWTEYDNEWVTSCDVIWRLPGESCGADREVELGAQHGIPTVHSPLELLDFRDRRLEPRHQAIDY